VLDGEVLLLRPDGSPAPFAALQRRLNRLRPDPQGSLFDQPRVTFRVYDLLEHRGVDIRARPLSERRDLLESQVSLGPVLSLSEPVRAGSWEALDELRRTSRGRGVEGFMLKRLSSRYLVGRADPGGQDIWWKWKVDPLSVDAVLVHAQPGSGRRATLLTDYTFALWDPDSSGRLVTFAKAYSGLTHEEIERLDAILRRTTTGKSGPVRHVEPTQVFEIGFEALAPSDRHRSGIAVRFPRILRWRQDKSPDQADTLAGLRVLLDRYGR
jgi:DNA ligase-1